MLALATLAGLAAGAYGWQAGRDYHDWHAAARQTIAYAWAILLYALVLNLTGA